MMKLWLIFHIVSLPFNIKVILIIKHRNTKW
nr:MAG TPA: hypothetical protein [Caudoviricetes sp.]